MSNQPEQCEPLRKRMIDGIKKLAILDEMKQYITNSIDMLGKTKSKKVASLNTESKIPIEKIEKMGSTVQKDFDEASNQYIEECTNPKKIKLQSSELCDKRMDEIILRTNQMNILASKDKENMSANLPPKNILRVIKMNQRIEDLIMEYSDLCSSELESTTDTLDRSVQFRAILDKIIQETEDQGIAFEEEARKQKKKYDIPSDSMYL